MKNTLKSPFNISIGTVIQGKWHQNKYVIMKELGRGAIGVVYLAEWNQKKVAMKLSDNNMTITSEVNVLKSFRKAQGVTLGPSLLDVDDWVTATGTFSFYVMEYIEGFQFLNFIKQNGRTWIDMFILQLLSDLSKLHTHGWVFGDLKPENLIVTGPPIKIRCIDVGGVTPQGRAIKEFTEFFDRGYWGLGSRKAEPSYDLFAVAMILINMYYPQRFQKNGDSLTFLKSKIKQVPELKEYYSLLIKALSGHYKNADEMRKDYLQVLSKKRMNVPQSSPTQMSGFSRRRQKKYQMTGPSGSSSFHLAKMKNRNLKRKQRKRTGLIESIVLLVLISFLYFMYIYQFI